jgi:Carboxypeptidase regulatory-like domain
MKYLQPWLVTLLLAAVTSIPFGCARQNSLGTVPVAGKVTHKGQPVEGATISFIPDGDGRPATAISGAGGAYSLFTLDSSGAIPGSYTVVVRKMETTTQSTQPVSMEEALKLNNRPPPPPKELLPAKYSDATKSPLKFEVKAGQSNTIDLTLAD